MNNDKITSQEIYTARIALDFLEDGELKPEIIESIKVSGCDVDVIKHLAIRMQTEGKLPEEQHRYQAKGQWEDWAQNSEAMFPEILDEFAVKDGTVQITEEEFLDVLAYVAREYFG